MKNFALMSAIALTSAVGLTACSSSEDATNSTADVNPTYDGSSVRTDFAFNVTKASQGTTRMTAAKTQNNNTFLGMSNMYLFPFTGEPAADKSTNLPSANPNYSLGDLTSADITTTSPTTGNSKKIYSLTLPIGTNNFLFYGTATRVNTETNFAVGKLTSSLDNVANTDNISFSLAQIATGLGADATNLAAYLTNIAKATNWAETVNYVNGTTSVTNPDAYVSLADLYTKFTTIYTDRCGSAEAIKRTIIDLYKSAKAINGQSSVTDVQTIATAICTAITATTSTVHMTIADSDADPENWTFTWVGLSDETFPAGTLKLPMGAVQLVFDGTSKTFSYKPTTSTSVTDLSSFGINYTDICYPSELVYFDNSPLRATDVYKQAAAYSSTPENWDKQFQDPPTTDDWKGTSVGPSTRAVAMQNNVNYGVSMLESTVMLQTATLTDNRRGILGGSATNQTDIDGTGMKVTGILIGGQPGAVDWNMVSNSSTGFDKIIYDNDVQYGNALSTTQSASNYTIVLDNLKGDGTTTTAPTDTQDDVNFALQIKNGNKDFYGKTGMIPAGSTFYLVGTLSASSPSTARVIPDVKTGASTTAKRNTVYRITHEATNRVFVQDYKTTANITINTDALKNAYSTIPDLRSTELLFGLSVDLSWQAGAIYNVTISGN